MDYFARSGALLGFVPLLENWGGDALGLLTEVGFGPSLLDNPDQYLPYQALADLYERTAHRTGRPDFGLQLGLQQGIEVVGALAGFLAHQDTVGQALWMLQRNLGFHARGVQLEWTWEAAQLEMSVQVQFDVQSQHRQLHFLNIALVRQGCAQLQNNRIQPLRVGFAFERPSELEQQAIETLLQCPVLWQQTHNAIVYPASLLGMPVDMDAPLKAKLDAWRLDCGMLNDTPDLTQQVRHTITALLPTGECRLELVAKLLNQHPRSLQIALQEYGTCYANLLQDVRFQLACQHLRQSKVNLTDLAFNLGFAELSVFSRSFKVWSGVSPRAWRYSRKAQ